MNGKVCVVTGALGNLGRPVAAGLLREGATVVLVARDGARAKATAAELAKDTGNANVETLVCDLADLGSVRRAAKELVDRHPAVHVLVNNAAYYGRDRKTSKDGFELMMATNHLGPFLFTQLLEGALAKGRARVVNMGMAVKNPIPVEDLFRERKWDAFDQFGVSKATVHHTTRELATRWAKHGVTVNELYPGFVKTTLIREAPLPIRIAFALIAASQEKGASYVLRVATAPELEGVSGHYFEKTQDRPFPPGSDDAAVRARLYDESLRLVGLAKGGASGAQAASA